MESLPLCAKILGMGRYLAGYQKLNVKTNPDTNPLIYNTVLPKKYDDIRVEESELLI